MNDDKYKRKFVLYFLVITLSIFVGATLRGSFMVDFDNIEMSYLDYSSRVSCRSDSMGLTVGCNDEVYGAKVEEGDYLDIGAIYIYGKGNKTIIHRLIGCIDHSCNITIFKGDNAKTGELVNREDILYKITRVEYK